MNVEAPMSEEMTASVNDALKLVYSPQYPDVETYNARNGTLNIWEGDDWGETELSWKESCYIHAGISSPETTIYGPDAQKLVSMSAINNCYKWPVGKAKHLVMCDENGLISSHALVNRTADDAFAMSAGNPWPWLKLLMTGQYNAQVSFRNVGIFQCAGPNSLTCLEDLTQQDLHDLKCLEFRPITVPGVEDADVIVQRVGMAGTLSYELRSDEEHASAVYDALYQVGKARYDMKRLGWRTYYVNHTEGGYAQVTCGFEQACDYDEAFLATGTNLCPPTYSGSYDPEDHRARLRTPAECGWDWMAKFDHDFVGREAVEAEKASPKRTIVTLEWNDDDVVDIFASQYRDEEPYKYMEMPIAPQGANGCHADRVLDLEGNVIGVSSAAVFSKYYQHEISQTTIDIDQAQIGNEVIVEWGDFGGRIKQVHAKVERYPYLQLVRNEKYDMATVPYGCPEEAIKTK